MYFFEQILNGFALGSIYALIAIGFSMVYGLLKLLNFAHSELITIGAYTGYILTGLFPDVQEINIYFLPALIFFSSLISGVSAVLLYFIGYKHIYRKSKIAVLITAIGFSVIIQNSLKLIFGAKSISYLPLEHSININLVTLIILVLSFMLIVFFLKRTMIGISIRAVADDEETASLMGIDTLKTIIFVFFMGGALAGVVGVIMGIRDGYINPFMGFTPGLKAFSISVVGGIGNLKGAVIVGLFLGLFEVLVQSYLPGEISQLRDVFVFCLLLVILVFKPSGLFGKKII